MWGPLEYGEYVHCGDIVKGYYEPSADPTVIHLDLSDLLQIVAYMTLDS